MNSLLPIEIIVMIIKCLCASFNELVTLKRVSIHFKVSVEIVLSKLTKVGILTHKNMIFNLHRITLHSCKCDFETVIDCCCVFCNRNYASSFYNLSLNNGWCVGPYTKPNKLYFSTPKKILEIYTDLTSHRFCMFINENVYEFPLLPNIVVFKCSYDVHNTKIPETFKNLRYVEGVHINDIHPSLLPQLNLYIYDAKRMSRAVKLRELPDTLTKLRVLVCRKNKIKSIPNTLTKLTFIDCRDNGSIVIPELPKLEVIYTNTTVSLPVSIRDKITFPT